MDNNPSQYKNHPLWPVDSVSWDDVQAFLRKLNEQEGDGGYRLPTEAQWEYACRADTETARYHHDIDAISWYRANSNGQLQPVGQKLPNTWGLYDMLGNMWEWCHDGGRTYTAGAAVDPIGQTGAGTDRVIRGGGWGDAARIARAAARGKNPPSYRSGDLGFRCVSSGNPLQNTSCKI